MIAERAGHTIVAIGTFLLGCAAALAQQGSGRKTPTFYHDVLPVMQGRCQVCHRTGGIAPMAFEEYEETRRHAGAIAAAVKSRSMPPWFAEKGVGEFANDPSMSDGEIAMLA